MKTFSLSERILGNIRQAMIPLLSSIRRRKLNRTDFTIISNNCWAGICYEYFGLQKLSPTVGLYFFADDYIKFVSDLRRYVNSEIHFISAKESRHKEILLEKGEQDIPVGVIDDIEIIFLHYKDPHVALDKWKRRCKRINWNNLILKFSYMNGCSDQHIHEFERICSKSNINHFEFVSHPFSEYPNAFVIESNKSQQIENDTFYWNKYCNVLDILNR